MAIIYSNVILLALPKLGFKMDWTSLLSPATIIGTIMAAIGLYLSWKTFKRQRFSYVLESATLMDKNENISFQDIEIHLGSKKIEKITSTKITIWNSGNTIIRNNDLAPADPLRMSVCNGAEVLNCRITKQSSSVNNFNIVSDINNQMIANFQFDFFAKNDGFSCEIIHTGEGNDVRIDGTIMNAKKSSLFKIKNKNYKKNILLGMTTIFAAIILILFLIAEKFELIPVIRNCENLTSAKNSLALYLYFLSSSFYLGFGLYILFSTLRSRMPSSLQSE